MPRRNPSPVGALRTANTKLAESNPFYFITPPLSSFRQEATHYLNDELDVISFIARASEDDPSSADPLTKTYTWCTSVPATVERPSGLLYEDSHQNGRWVRHEYAIEATVRPRARNSRALSELLRGNNKTVVTLPTQPDTTLAAFDKSLAVCESKDFYFKHVLLDENQVPLTSTEGGTEWQYEAVWPMEVDDSLGDAVTGYITGEGFRGVVHPWLALRVYSSEAGTRPT
ncbi:hypothetical protein IAR50_000478 [Cryptococcus sp. DSM 104548]